jgi:hypothetical protein
MGDRKIIGSLFCLRTHRARNRMAIRTQIRTRVGGRLHDYDFVYDSAYDFMPDLHSSQIGIQFFI